MFLDSSLMRLDSHIMGRSECRKYEVRNMCEESKKVRFGLWKQWVLTRFVEITRLGEGACVDFSDNSSGRWT